MRTQLNLALMLFVAVFFAAVPSFAQKTTDTKKFDVSKGGRLIVEIDDMSADIYIKVWDKTQVLIKTEGISDDDEDLEMRKADNTVYVEFYGRGRRWHSRAARFTINVPEEFNLDLRTSGGDIEIDDLVKGEVRATTSGGDIEVKDVEGQLELATSGGDVTARNVKGNAELKTSGGDIEIGDVDGELDAATSGGDIVVGNVAKRLDAKTAGGDIEIGNVGADADVRTAGGDIVVGEVTGRADLSTAGGSIEIKSATGDVSAQTAGGDMVLENIRGSIDAQTAGGDIEVELIPTGKHKSVIETKGGNIQMYIPDDAKATIEAEIRIYYGEDWGRDGDDYDIYSDFKEDRKDRDRRGVTASYVLNGGGQRITLETMQGDIEIRKMKSR